MEPFATTRVPLRPRAAELTAPGEPLHPADPVGPEDPHEPIETSYCTVDGICWTAICIEPTGGNRTCVCAP